MTDIVIPYRKTIHTKELRYCLRSIETYLTDVGQVFIVGELPDWVQNVVHIPFEDNPDDRWKHHNLYLKTLAACKDQRVSDPFLFMNDDHYFLTKISAAEIPYLYTATPPTQGKYVETTMFNTFGAIGRARYFDIHFPILFEKDRYEKVVGAVNWSKPYGYCIKSIYCNGMDGEPSEDLKLRVPGERPTGDWFSTSDKSFTESIMQELYPNISKYEREGTANA